MGNGNVSLISLSELSLLLFSRSVVSNSLRSHVLHYLHMFAQIYVHWVSNAIQPPHPMPPSSPFSLSLSLNQGLFQWISSSLQEANVLELQIQHQSNEYSELISFTIDWLDLLAVQGTIKSLLQHHNSKASVLWCSVYFMVQFSHS